VGVRFGADALPDRWLDKLEYCEELALLGKAVATTEFEK